MDEVAPSHLWQGSVSQRIPGHEITKRKFSVQLNSLWVKGAGLPAPFSRSGAWMHTALDFFAPSSRTKKYAASAAYRLPCLHPCL